ncbi:DUF4230 domain-containing protein [Altererythrobacter aurantiacus]|uniref:DUF4230 domain-containing protein n=1 Tax=Parapontixanthobacter aurantiacus TaxID=1463599 RepID=A0A844Z7E1_9SPHN|nr:DUF4230 domain-containing protein [Parapontixanthobacter aurantiacus]MXO84541.1 DUF4230 domain-containing protein [Parapontixanthobacter aurantiacus]
MADRLRPSDRVRSPEIRTDPPLPERRTGNPLRVVPWFLVIALLAVVAWLGWRAFGPDPDGDPLATSLIAFEEQNRLTVFSAQLAPVVSSTDSRFFGTVNSRQVAVIPARVDYTLDLSGVDASRLGWDEASETLSVRLPDITVGKPNLDEARAQYLREGIWISREAQDELTRANTRQAETQAVKNANNPVLLRLARDAARAAVTQNLTTPLKVAGYENAQVEVSFDGENAASGQAGS